VTELKNRIAALLSSPKRKAMVEEGLKFSTAGQRVVINSALQALMARDPGFAAQKD
jgi:hypothetical protein